MKKTRTILYLLMIVLAFATACTSRVDRTIADLNLMLDSLKSEYAPDSRVELWSLDLQVLGREIILDGEVASPEIYAAISSLLRSEFPSVHNRVILLPEEDPGRLVNALVNNSVAHLRRAPSSKTELVSQALLGAPLRILKEERGMYFIQLADGYLGWVNVNEVHFMEPGELSAYRDRDKVIYASQYGFAYTQADENSLPVADLVIGCLLPIVSEEGAFYETSYPDGRKAWVKKSEVFPAERIFLAESYLNEIAGEFAGALAGETSGGTAGKTTTEIAAELAGEAVVETAMAYHGIPYLWGGASSKNLDCSGFVSNVFFMNGIQMPRDADQQAFCGRELSTEYSPEGLQKGDLLFFGKKATAGEPERVSHVAIYIGEGEFIHAAGYRDRVGINSMDSTRANYIDSYPEIFVRASRILGEKGKGFGPIVANPYYKEIINQN